MFHLPAEAATARRLHANSAGWDVTAFLMADVYAALTGKAHPARPKPGDADKATRYRALRAQLEAQRARQTQSV